MSTYLRIQTMLLEELEGLDFFLDLPRWMGDIQELAEKRASRVMDNINRGLRHAWGQGVITTKEIESLVAEVKKKEYTHLTVTLDDLDGGLIIVCHPQGKGKV